MGAKHSVYSDNDIDAPVPKKAKMNDDDHWFNCLGLDPSLRPATQCSPEFQRIFFLCALGRALSAKQETRPGHPLHLACRHGSIFDVVSVIEHGKNCATLHPALVQPYVQELLTIRDFEPSVIAATGISPVYLAVGHNDLLMTEYLLQSGVDITAEKTSSPNNTSPLQSAVIQADVNVVRSLIVNGADVNAANDQGITPLISAIVARNTEMVRLLIKHGANVNAWRIVDNGLPDSERLLTDADGKETVMMFAFWTANTDIIKLLLDQRPSINRHFVSCLQQLFAARRIEYDFNSFLR